MPQRCEARRVCSPPARPPGWEGERWRGALLCPAAGLSLAPSAPGLQEEHGNCAATVIITLCFQVRLWSSALRALSLGGWIPFYAFQLSGVAAFCTSVSNTVCSIISVTLITSFALGSPLVFIFLPLLALLWRMQCSGVISSLLQCLSLILGRVSPGALGKHKHQGKGGSSECLSELVKRGFERVRYLMKTQAGL